MNIDLDELRKKRLRWVEANRDNGFDEGINRLLTQLYPDNAHFIYELLQNAEDPEATQVVFILSEYSIEFEHNGKRLFSLKDVESITSIGNSTKRDDPTSIGKFGVGFKAVFAYTNTPEIQSGDFYFRIHDLVVPDISGVQHTNNSDRKTSFIFPFDNPKKSPEIAVNEIETGLQNLGDNTLLFLSHIRKIEYTFQDGSSGSLRRIDHNSGRIEIHAKHPGGDETISHWLHFQKVVEVNDEDGKAKTCRIAIAYLLEQETGKNQENSTWKIVAVDGGGQVSIFFPAEKETSKLRFHLHAPFASTVARDSVRDCHANVQLRDHLAELAVESLTAIREQGMLGMSFLAVLPNPRDSLAKFYEPIRLAIVNAFKSQALTPTRSGSHAKAESLYRGSAKIAEVITDEDLSLLTEYEIPLWAANPPQLNQREDNFLDSLTIDRWDFEQLSALFKPTDKEKIESWLAQKDDDWMMRFYALLGEAHSSQKQAPFVSNFRVVKVEIDQGDKLVIPSQAYFPATEGITLPQDIFIVKKSVYDAGRSDEQKRLAKLFLEKAGIRFFDTKELIKLKLTAYDKLPNQVPADYMADIKMFVEYWQSHPTLGIDLFENHTFLRGKSRDDQIQWYKPHDLYLDNPFVDTGLKNLFNDKNLQLEKYKSELLEKYYDILHFADFAVAIGVMDRLEIRNHDATAMQSDLVQQSGRKNKNNRR